MGISMFDYYVKLAASINDSALKDIDSISKWKVKRDGLYKQFMQSMGLNPLPQKCDLKVRRMGEFSGNGYRVEKLAYQILPDCWATGCLYYPDPLSDEKLPAVLYLCGHYPIGVEGYQSHAVMWARRGYICFVFDTIEQHDNPGNHHGLCHGLRYDWISMGYTGAGGELWNSIRALDLLMTIPEVDNNRIAATGNSGGGAQSFYLTIADSRIKALASSCGISVPKYALAHRHLMNHCDCMYFHNVYQRDTSEFGALIAPRPALFCFAMEDLLFSQDEYKGLVKLMRKIYRLYNCEDKCRLFEYHGPHGYQPESVKMINKWFDKYIGNGTHPDIERGESEHSEQEITVFSGKIPESNKLSLLPELISPIGSVELPRCPEDWPGIREAAKKSLREEIFHTIDRMDEKLKVEEVGTWLCGKTVVWSKYSGHIGGMDVWLYIFSPLSKRSDKVIIGLVEQGQDIENMYRKLVGDFNNDHTIVLVESRGSGFSSWHPSQKNFLLRAGALTGVTPAMMLIYDLHHIVKFLRELPAVKDRQVYLYGKGDAAVACLYSAILNEHIAGVIAEDLPASHHKGAYILGILRILDLKHTIGLVAPRPVALINPNTKCLWAERLYRRLNCSSHLIRENFLNAAFHKILSLKI